MHLHPEAVALVEEDREDHEGDRPEDLDRDAEDHAGEELVGPGLAEGDEGDRLALGQDQDDAADHEVHPERRDQRREVGVDDERADAASPCTRPVTIAARMPRNGSHPGLHHQREGPGREAHRRGKRQVDLARRHHEDQRHRHEDRDRQRRQHRAVERPAGEDRGIRDQEDERASPRRPRASRWAPGCS